MTQPPNGITTEVIRDLMPPYRLDQDLLAATFACIAPPPPDATTAQRHARITRLLSEVAGLRPADAAQARIATQILIIREFADTLIARAHTEALEINQLCRVARSNADLQRSANALERSLTRHQQNPVPFYGTVIQDEVDIAALDATWGHRAPTAAPHPTPRATTSRRAATTPAPADATPTAPATITPPRTNAPPPPTATAAPPPPAAPAALPAAAPPQPPPPPAPTPHDPTPTTRPASSDPTTEWTITRLDQGPGWTREVLRHRDATPTPQAAE